MIRVNVKNAGWVLLLSALAASASAAEAPVDKCQLLLSSNQIEYGKHSPAELSAVSGLSGVKAFDKRLVTVNINCSEPQRMTLWSRGVDLGKKGVPFGKGGVLVVRAMQAQLDHSAVQLSAVSSASEAPGPGRDKVLLRPNQGVAVAGGAVGRQWSMQLEVAPYLSNAATRVKAVEPFDGVLNLELTSTNP